MSKLLTMVAGASMALITLALSTGGASAATISVVTDSKSVDLTCSGSCEVWELDLDPDGFSTMSGDWLSAVYGGIGNANGSGDRVDFVNNVLGTSFTLQSASSDTISGVPSLSGFADGDDGGWFGSAQYYLAWGGFDPRYVLIKNNSANNYFTWNSTGRGSGLSGADGFGGVAPVPLPAAGFMLLAALGGLGLMRRRKTA